MTPRVCSLLTLLGDSGGVPLRWIVWLSVSITISIGAEFLAPQADHDARQVDFDTAPKTDLCEERIQTLKKEGNF